MILEQKHLFCAFTRSEEVQRAHAATAFTQDEDDGTYDLSHLSLEWARVVFLLVAKNCGPSVVLLQRSSILQ